MKPGETDPGIPLAWRSLREGGPGLFAPADPDALLAALGEAEFRASDERMPYFATLWPSGLALAAHLLDGPSLAGHRVLDLGCGVGPVGIAAAWRGADVTFLDWEPRALSIVRRSLQALGLRATTVAADWRAPPPLLPFSRILAADVLYEARNLPGVVGFAAAHLAPGGEAWIVDPGRGHAEGLVRLAEASGLRRVAVVALAPPPPAREVTLHRFGGAGPRPGSVRS